MRILLWRQHLWDLGRAGCHRGVGHRASFIDEAGVGWFLPMMGQTLGLSKSDMLMS